MRAVPAHAALLLLALAGLAYGAVSPTPAPAYTDARAMAATATAIAQAKADAITAAKANTASALATATSGLVTPQALAAVQATIPTPLAAVPPPATPSGATGTAPTYVPGDARPPSQIRAATVTTDASGNWSVTWATPLVSSTPAVLPVPLDTTAATVSCKVLTRSGTVATGKCSSQVNSSVITLLGLAVTLASAPPATGMSVMVIAREPTQ